MSGEARLRKEKRIRDFGFSKSMSRARFNVFTIGTRLSHVYLISEEYSWWSSEDETLLGTVVLDHTDRDYSWVIFARDRNGRFRCADLSVSIETEYRAEEQLRFRLAELARNGGVDAFGDQGDETNAPLDLLRLPTDYKPDELHPYFRILLEDPGREPARAIIREIGPWLTPQDPHLVKEFQTKGFDQRLWEIYLWAAFKEFALDVELLEAPDFYCSGRGHDFTVEATTVAPSDHGELARHPNPKTREELEEFLNNYMALKYGSALTSKLRKTTAKGLRYWQREKSKDKPFLIAIADFHEPPEKNELGSMTYTQSALWQYLYGHRVYWHIVDDQVIIREASVKEHKYGKKVAPSGFFDLPDCENISAVVFSNAGTLAKFNRMGVCAGFGAAGYKYIRYGLKYDPDPNARFGIPFSADVSDKEYEEYWTQEVQVFHNPNAKHPLDFDALPGASHHYYEDGMIRSLMPVDTILSSASVLLKISE